MEEIELSEDKLNELLDGKAASIKVYVQYLDGQKYGVILQDGVIKSTYKLHEDEWIDTVIKRIGDADGST